MKTQNSGLNEGALLMLIGSLAFIGYAVVFLFRNFAGSGFELGVRLRISVIAISSIGGS